MNTKKCVSFQCLTVGFDLSVLSDIYRNHFGDGDDVDGHQKPWLVLMVNRDDGSAVVVVAVAL